MTEQEVKELLIKTNAIMEGHFLLTSGLHSPMYVEKFNVLQQPKYTEQLCKALAEYFADKNIDTVVGPMTGGIFKAEVSADCDVSDGSSVVGTIFPGKNPPCRKKAVSLRKIYGKALENRTLL